MASIYKGGTAMKVEEIYKDWKSLFPLSEAHVEC